MKAQGRGKNVAAAGVAFQLIFTAVMVVVLVWTRSASAVSTAVFLAGGVGMWAMLTLLFYCRLLARRETIELEEIRAGGGNEATIFGEGAEAELRIAARRVEWIDRWLVPIFTLLLAGYYITSGVLLFQNFAKGFAPSLVSPAGGLLVLVVIGFLAFLFSSYTIGMARGAQWRPLRSGGSYLLMCVLMIAATAASLLAAWQNYPIVDRVVAVVIPIIQFVLAIELLISFVFDLYRPRVAGQEQRLTFDSRLLNLIAEPSRVGHSITETLNYQFGFEISRTWFYLLVSRAFLPIILFGVLIMFAISSVMIVRTGEQAVVMQWGRIDSQRGTLKSGLHFKYPWPVESVRYFNTDRVHSIHLGVGKERDNVIKIGGRDMNIWTEDHGDHVENDFLIAIPPENVQYGSVGEQKPPPVNIIKLVLSIQYVIDDAYDYGFKFDNLDKLLECVAYSEMVNYCSSATLDTPIPGNKGDRPEAIMTSGRAAAAANLQQRIQKAVGTEGLGLGVRIVRVGIEAAHPPAEAAKVFVEVLTAERSQDVALYNAETEANIILSAVAGNPDDALKLGLAIRKLTELQDLKKLQSDPAQFGHRLKEFINRAEDDIDSLTKEIDIERLRGLHVAGRRTFRQELLEKHTQRRELFTQVAEAGGEFDFAPLIVRQDKLAATLFERAVGQPAASDAQAKAKRWSQELTERARAETFQRQLEGYQASPNIFKLSRLLELWEEYLPEINKYVLTFPKDRIEIRINTEVKVDPFERVTFKREQNAN